MLAKVSRVTNFKNGGTSIHRQYLTTLPEGKEFLAIVYVFTGQLSLTTGILWAKKAFSFFKISRDGEFRSWK
jgi:hypothetical protein